MWINICKWVVKRKNVTTWIYFCRYGRLWASFTLILPPHKNIYFPVDVSASQHHTDSLPPLCRRYLTFRKAHCSPEINDFDGKLYNPGPKRIVQSLLNPPTWASISATSVASKKLSLVRSTLANWVQAELRLWTGGASSPMSPRSALPLFCALVYVAKETILSGYPGDSYVIEQRIALIWCAAKEIGWTSNRNVPLLY